jgi:hypothetical protein
MADGSRGQYGCDSAVFGFAVAPEKDAHQIPTPSPSHDLSGFTSQTQILLKNLAHRWHTGGGKDCFNSTTWGEEE